MSWAASVDRIVGQEFASLVELRRHLHQNPEPSGQETQTSFFLYTQLGDAGLSVQLGPNGCGVVSDLNDSNSPRRVAVRGDIDALRIYDEKDVPYRSQCDGIMHACGHDVHSTIATGTMFVLGKLAAIEALPWPVSARGILQPAEETCRGARELIDSGAMLGVDVIYSMHVDPTLPVGRVGIRDGVLTAGCDEISFKIHGTGGHAARPHLARDPISAAAELIHALYLHIPRVTDSQEAVVLTIGQIQGGHSFNVIPDIVTLKGTIRTLDRSVRDSSVDHIMRIARGIAELTETSITVELGLSAPPVVNHHQEIVRMRALCEQMLGPQSIHEIVRPSMGSEDFAYYVRDTPGCMVRLGCSSATKGGHGLHTALFDVDEEVIRVGVCLMTRAVIERCKP